MSHPSSAPEPIREPRLASVASWAVLVASFGLSASTWIALAELAGFSGSWTIGSVTAKLAWLMPVSVDGYLVVALVLWMSPVPAHIAAFARKNTYGSAAIGILAQSAYHSLLTWSATGVLWRAVMAALVGALPPAFAGLAVHMRALIRREGRRNQTVPVLPVAVATPAPVQVPVVPAQRPAPAAPMTPVRAAPPPPAMPRRYPTSVVPADAELPSSRRPPHLTRTLAEELMSQYPDMTKKDVADKLGISDRQLRNVMNGASMS